MKILMITPNFPPILSPGSLHCGKLAMALAQAGADLTVLTQERPSYTDNDLSDVWKEPPYKEIRIKSAGKISSGLAKLRNLDRKSNWFYLLAIKEASKIIAREKFDLILTRSNPSDPTFIGHELKKRHGARWAAEFSDPFPDFLLPPPYGPGKPVGVFESFVFRRAGKALAAADHVIFPGERLAGYMRHKHGLDFGSRLIVAPHIGWRRDPKPDRKNEEFRILHLGGVGHERASTDIFKALDELREGRPEIVEKLKLAFYGNVHPRMMDFFNSRGMESYIEVHSPVPYEEALGLSAEADALLLLEAVMDEGIYLPSKFCDYARAGKPLLAFSPENGTISDLLGGNSHPGFLGQKPENYRAKLRKLLDRAENGGDLDDYLYPHPGDFTPEKVAKTIMEGVGA